MCPLLCAQRRLLPAAPCTAAAVPPFANPGGPPFLDAITFAYCDEEDVVCSTSVIANSTATHATATPDGVVTELGGCSPLCGCPLPRQHNSMPVPSCAAPVAGCRRLRCLLSRALPHPLPPHRQLASPRLAATSATPACLPTCLPAGRYTTWQCSDAVADPGAYYAAVSMTLIHPNGTSAATRQLCEYGLVDLATNTHYW